MIDEHAHVTAIGDASATDGSWSLLAYLAEESIRIMRSAVETEDRIPHGLIRPIIRCYGWPGMNRRDTFELGMTSGRREHEHERGRKELSKKGYRTVFNYGYR